jgi:hypothetical protein
MKLNARIESLRCTEGSSDKGYTLISLESKEVGTAFKMMITIYGPIKSPNQTMMVVNHKEDSWFAALKTKLKKYNRCKPAGDFVAEVLQSDHKTIADWLMHIIAQHGEWESISPNFAQKFRLDLNRSLSGGFSDTQETESVDDLFRTQKQMRSHREQARKQEQESKKLEHWGAF